MNQEKSEWWVKMRLHSYIFNFFENGKVLLVRTQKSKPQMKFKKQN